MKNDDWLLMLLGTEFFSNFFILILPLILILGLFSACEGVFDPSRIESPEKELEKFGKVYKSIFIDGQK